MSAENFTHHYHVPEFLDEVVSTATVEVLTACGDSVQCVFDASQTGDISIGLETMVTSEVNTENRLEASEFYLNYHLLEFLTEKSKQSIQTVYIERKCY